MLCLWVNGQLNTAIREPSRILELGIRLTIVNSKEIPEEWIFLVKRYRQVLLPCYIL